MHRLAYGTLLLLVLTGVSSVPLATEEPSQPKISYSRETVAKPGDDVTIDCGVEGIDLSGVQEFNVAWSKIDLEKPTNSYPISSGDKVVLFSAKYSVVHPKDTYQYSLQIKNIDEEDTGTYRCTVNFGDNQKINAEVPVMIEKSPYFVDPSTKTLTVTVGDAISIDCQPGGWPKPTVFWERVNQELPFYGGNFFKSNQLDIPFVESTHEGRYACHADNGLGDPAKSEVILAVQYPPNVRVSQETMGSSIGKTAEVVCTVDAHPMAEVSWYRDDDIILGSANIRVSQEVKDQDDAQRKEVSEMVGVRKVVTSTLTVEKVTADVLGNYYCTATNIVGSNNKTVTFTLKSPPKIERQSSRKVFYNDEEAFGRDSIPVSIECSASGVPAPEYRWTRNNQHLVWQSEPRMSLEPETGTLLIEDPTVKDNGWYQCVAYNELGVAKSDPIYLLNATRVTFDIDAKQFVNMTAEEGRPFKMSCPNVKGDPKPELTWAMAYSEGPNSNQTKMAFFSNNRTVVGPNGTAYFTHVLQEDDTDVGGQTYICLGVSESSPQDYSLGTSVRLKVVKPRDGVHNAEMDHLNIETFLMYGSPNVTLLKGAKENRLWCIFGGEPVPSVQWFRLDGNPLTGSEYKFVNNNSTLVITNTNSSHQAGYRCSAGNGIGPSYDHTMFVQVDMPPVFREVMRSSTVEQGSKVSFTCDAEGSGVLTYNWYFNGREIGHVEGSKRVTEGNRLTISSVSLTDTGNYACNATSRSGYAYGQATLNVLPTADGANVATSCPEVGALRSELSTVKESLQKLRDLVKNTRTVESDASINLIQRIASKLNILTKEEQELFKRNQEDIAIQADLLKEANNRDKVPEPQFLYAENTNRNEDVMNDGEQEESNSTATKESNSTATKESNSTATKETNSTATKETNSTATKETNSTDKEPQEEESSASDTSVTASTAADDDESEVESGSSTTEPTPAKSPEPSSSTVAEKTQETKTSDDNDTAVSEIKSEPEPEPSSSDDDTAVSELKSEPEPEPSSSDDDAAVSELKAEKEPQPSSSDDDSESEASTSSPTSQQESKKRKAKI